MQNENNNSYSKSLFVIGWIIIIGGIIGSFILGDTTPTLEDILRGRYYGDFNVTIFLFGTVSSIILGALFLGIGEMIRLLDSSNYIMQQMLCNANACSTDTKDNSASATNTDNSDDDELPYI